MIGRAAIMTSDNLEAYDLGPNHPLRPERLKIAFALMKSYGLMPSVSLLPSRIAEPAELFLFHTKEYVEKVKEYSKRGYGLLDMGDTPAFKGCYEATSWVVGSSLAAVEAVMNGTADHAFNFSGGLHHAHPDRASGFCIFNDPAVCIAFLKKKYSLKRIAYIDLDAHHGDGVMYGFYSDPSVLDIDLHEDGHYLFPGTGFADETGEGDAKGLKINVPLPPKTGDALYLEAFERIVPPSIMRYKPEIILLQSGADSHRNDPLTHLSITVRSYGEAASKIHELAHRVCGGKVVVCGGGGYNLANAARCWTTVMATFTQSKIPEVIPNYWREYYRSVLGREAPQFLTDPEEKTSDYVRREVAGTLDQLEKSTCISRSSPG